MNLSSVALFASYNFGALLIRTEDEFELYEFEGDYNESEFTNITREYLANTYGKVESKEHAEFIKLLAEVNEMPCGVVSVDMNYKFFYVINGCLFFCVEEIDAVGDYKQITIPMLPKEVEVAGAVDEWPKIGDRVLAIGNKCTVISLADKHGCLAVMSEKGFNMLVFKSDIQKLKTPEEELRDEFAKDLNSIYLLSDIITASPSCDDDFKAYANEMVKLGWVKSGKQ